MDNITTTPSLTEAAIWQVLESVKDPEIPVLSLMDMGMITKVESSTAQSAIKATITMTPTFVGCPAINVMKKDIHDAVKTLGYDEVEVNVDMETTWNSNCMRPGAKEKLEKFGIAPPVDYTKDEELTMEMLDRVRCPHCGSTDTTLRSSFGSTLCRAIRFCFSCKQGFEQFKPI